MASIVHRLHPDPQFDDPREARLFDACMACRENADRPLGRLDEEHISALLHATLSAQLFQIPFRTGVEGLAARNLFEEFATCGVVVDQDILPFALEPEDRDVDAYEFEQCDWWYTIYELLHRAAATRPPIQEVDEN